MNSIVTLSAGVLVLALGAAVAACGSAPTSPADGDQHDGGAGGSGPDGGSADANAIEDAAVEDAGGADSGTADSGGVDATAPLSIPPKCPLTVYTKGDITSAKTISLKSVVANGGQPITTLVTGVYDVDTYANNVVFAEFVVPATGHGMSYAEYGSIYTSRMVYASKTPCDMTSSSLIDTAGSGTVQFHIDQMNPSGVYKREVYMATGETWYLMIVNYDVDATSGSPTAGLPIRGSCPATDDCSMRLGTF